MTLLTYSSRPDEPDFLYRTPPFQPSLMAPSRRCRLRCRRTPKQMINQTLRRRTTQPRFSAQDASSIPEWTRLFQLPGARTTKVSNTAALLDAVLSGQATGGGPVHFTRAPTSDTTGPKSRHKTTSRAAAFVATTAGQVALCTAVAAASVGGVYATTDRIDVSGAPNVADIADLPGASDVADIADLPGASDVADIADAPSSERWSEIENLARAANDHDQEVVGLQELVGLVIATDIGGCEGGRAIAQLASANAGDRPQIPDPGSDPCGRSEQGRTAAANSGPENRRDHDIEGVELPEAASNGTARAPEGTEERGRPADIGKPDRSGNGK